MLELKSNRPSIFECDVDVENISKLNGVRLVLEFDNAKYSYLIEGKVDQYQNCIFEIPAMRGRVGRTGKARLEVIGDKLLFNVWKGHFEVV